ncbi:mediator of RNA polymerase II transcription subunit 29-like [Oppia nitens]|uniref:mediator of RNA polymerase II transcription subunit 29-like n=1 Tax=Oppia nitens TaxID=1686743 RepID=UPI0023D9D3D0|nr:mediator of RNA polymerase II transcription subunit 29-like [Oppia nitens]
MASMTSQQQPPAMAGQQQQSAASGQSNQPPGDQKSEPIIRVRQLVWALKDSLANVMKVAANNIHRNSLIDTVGKTNDQSDNVVRFDKALEDFFSICNQIELHLKTIHEVAIQVKDSHLYLPFNINKLDVDVNTAITPDSMSYNQYIMTIKNQVNFAKSVHDMLVDGSKRIAQPDLPITGNPMINPATPAPNQ